MADVDLVRHVQSKKRKLVEQSQWHSLADYAAISGFLAGDNEATATLLEASRNGYQLCFIALAVAIAKLSYKAGHSDHLTNAPYARALPLRLRPQHAHCKYRKVHGKLVCLKFTIIGGIDCTTCDILKHLDPGIELSRILSRQ